MRWRKRARRALIIVATSAMTAAVAAPAAPRTNTASGDQITLNFQDVDIQALINTVSHITGKNFIVDPRVKGKVTVVSGGPLNASQIYPVFLSVLEVHNFAAVPSGEVTKIIPSNIVKQMPTPTHYGIDRVAGDDQMTQVYQLEHASVQDLVPILRPLLPPTSHFAAHAASNTLVFTDTADNVQRVLGIIKRIDVPDRSANVHVVYLKYARASELAQVVSQLAGSLRSVGGDPKAKTQTTSVSVQSDNATNALIITATDSEYQLMRAVIDQLDIERTKVGDVRVVYLRFAKAKDLVPLLNKLTQSTASADPKAATKSDARVTVQADEATNSLVINAPEDEFRTLKDVIEKLDVRREQVFVETIIAEVSANKAADLGVEWQFLDKNSPSGEGFGSTSFSPFTGGLTLGYLNNLVQSLTGAIVPDLQIVLRALRSDSNTNILSTPNLLTLDNEKAEIVVAQEVPFVTGQFVSTASTATTVPPPTGGTGEGTSIVNPFQTIQRKDVGIILRITPQINEGNTIRMEIEQEISNVSPEPLEGASDITTFKRSIKATVQVDDGQIVVLGGLIRDDVIDSMEWVPILGKIPVIGALFRRKSKSAVKTNLMVFLRPKIIRTAEDIAGYTRDKYGHVRRLEVESRTGSHNMIQGVQNPTLPEIDWNLEKGAPAAPRQ